MGEELFEASGGDDEAISNFVFLVVELVGVGLTGVELGLFQDDGVLTVLVRILVLPDLISLLIEQADFHHAAVGNLVADHHIIPTEFISFQSDLGVDIVRTRS